LFAPGKIPWKTLKLHPSPEKLCSEADFMDRRERPMRRTYEVVRS